MSGCDRIKLGSVIISSMISANAMAGLGDINVRSHAGEPFQADIHLQGFSVSELDNARISLAEDNEVRDITLSSGAYLSSLRFTLISSEQGAMIHISSALPLDAPSLRFAVKFEALSKWEVREYIAMLAPLPAQAVMKFPAAEQAPLTGSNTAIAPAAANSVVAPAAQAIAPAVAAQPASLTTPTNPVAPAATPVLAVNTAVPAIPAATTVLVSPPAPSAAADVAASSPIIASTPAIAATAPAAQAIAPAVAAQPAPSPVAATTTSQTAAPALAASTATPTIPAAATVVASAPTPSAAAEAADAATTSPTVASTPAIATTAPAQPVGTEGTRPSTKAELDGIIARNQTKHAAPVVKHAQHIRHSKAWHHLHASQGSSLWKLARKVKPAHASMQQTMTALFHANKHAFVGGNPDRLKLGAVLHMPSYSRIKAVSKGQIQHTLHQNKVQAAKAAQATSPAAASSAKLAAKDAHIKELEKRLHDLDTAMSKADGLNKRIEKLQQQLSN